MPDLTVSLDLIESGHQIPAARFVMQIAPYLAHLLTRHPKVRLPLWPIGQPGPDPHVPDLSDLTSRPERLDEHDRRHGVMGAMVDTVLFGIRWTVAVAPREQPWITTDIGVAWLPGTGIGRHVIPLSARHAVVLGPGAPTYAFGADDVRISAYKWTAEDVNVVNDVLALLAPREVYARTESQAERVLDLWAAPNRASVSTDGVPAALLAGRDPEDGPWLLLQGRLYDPLRSWSRFITANHQFACNCSEAISRLPEEERPAAAALHRKRLDMAQNSLRGPQAVSPGSDRPHGRRVDRSREYGDRHRK